MATQTDSAPVADTAPAPRPSTKDGSGFDIVKTYQDFISSDPEVTKPVAAIESLIALLNVTSSTTVFETLETLTEQIEILRAHVPNNRPLTAGTDLFRQYIISSLNTQGSASFDAIRQHLLRNGRLFASRAIAARQGVAEAGWRYVTEGKTVLTHGASRCVTSLLEKANASAPGKFKVIYVQDHSHPGESDKCVKKLRSMGIPVAVIREAAVAHVMKLRRRVDMVFVGAEVVTQDGGIISRIGTLLVAQLAHDSKIPFYVCAETHKFYRHFPFSQEDVVQDVLDFSPDGDVKPRPDLIDYTHPRLISNLITENGVKLPVYVLEQLLDIYGSLNG